MFKRILVIAFVGCVFAATSALHAQDQTYFTYVSQWAAPRSDWADFAKQAKDDEAAMQKLVADGTIIDWGSTAVRVHDESGYTHADWFTATSRANLLKALEEITGSSTAPAFAAATKHSDLFLRTLAHGGKAASGATGYLRVALYQARPGAGSAFESQFKAILKPMLDQDVENGTLLMYNFDEEDIHSDAPGAYNLAMLFPDGAALDKFYTELAAKEKQDPSAEEVFANLTVEKEHRDTLSRVLAYQHK